MNNRSQEDAIREWSVLASHLTETQMKDVNKAMKKATTSRQKTKAAFLKGLASAFFNPGREFKKKEAKLDETAENLEMERAIHREMAQSASSFSFEELSRHLRTAVASTTGNRAARAQTVSNRRREASERAEAASPAQDSDAEMSDAIGGLQAASPQHPADGKDASARSVPAPVAAHRPRRHDDIRKHPQFELVRDACDMDMDRVLVKSSDLPRDCLYCLRGFVAGQYVYKGDKCPDQHLVHQECQIEAICYAVDVLSLPASERDEAMPSWRTALLCPLKCPNPVVDVSWFEPSSSSSSSGNGSSSSSSALRSAG